MDYSRTVSLSQAQVLDNLSAIVKSEYFKQYEFFPEGSQIRSDIINLSSIGGGFGLEPIDLDRLFVVDDLAAPLDCVFGVIKSKGNLNYSRLVITPAKDALRAMGFEDKVFLLDDRFTLPLGFYVVGCGRERKFEFEIKQDGVSRRHFPELGLNLKAANQVLGSWYRELDHNLQKILPHQFGTPR